MMTGQQQSQLDLITHARMPQTRISRISCRPHQQNQNGVLMGFWNCFWTHHTSGGLEKQTLNDFLINSTVVRADRVQSGNFVTGFFQSRIKISPVAHTMTFKRQRVACHPEQCLFHSETLGSPLGCPHMTSVGVSLDWGSHSGC